MHPELLKDIVELCKQRQAQGDYPTEAIADAEVLENAIVQLATLPALPKPRVLASGTIAGKAIELRGWHTEDIEIWERQHGLTFGA
ncbi:hypothetical protein [Candidatus Accumulibacter vicinus]|uniref:Uncharacterized protein n=1 Tax=Candidatus Accumulibacter vicinus TaxID=2954382 RepID=A0A084XWL6_9PROT|nr:hypothetical protein [Candidatus Accumulibacter vicinus]KFB66860.1 MAG: hypothetical protein CAPSK01_003799 [Candidatus Accumulibacter vicinus]